MVSLLEEQLDSTIYFCILSAWYHMSCNPWKTPLHTCERTSGKGNVTCTQTLIRKWNWILFLPQREKNNPIASRCWQRKGLILYHSIVMKMVLTLQIPKGLSDSPRSPDHTLRIAALTRCSHTWRYLLLPVLWAYQYTFIFSLKLLELGFCYLQLKEFWLIHK